ncbi:MAG: helix-turn-helix transcriptional regulator [Pseudomonadota bacterium]
MDLNQIFARSVRKLRHEQGLSQDDLGEMSGLTRNYIGMIERDETSPTLDSVAAIAKALGKSAKDLL